MALGEETNSIHIISSTVDQICSGPNDLETIITRCAATQTTARALFTASNGFVCSLWISPSPDHSTIQFQDAIKQCEKWLASTMQISLVTLLSLDGLETTTELKENSNPSLFLVLAKYNGELEKSVLLPRHESEELRETRQSLLGTASSKPLNSRWNINWHRARNYIVISIVFLVIALLSLFSALHKQHGDVWVRYDTHGSDGPQYQLQFDHQNVSTWAESHLQEREWFLRIDDQAMIPAELLDEEESRYQRWFQQRYPEMNEIRLQQDYVNSTFLADPYSIQVPSDYTFHMAHCVRAFRRYWQAKETGRHVCPRDIDYRHMKHCLDAMDEWAFIDGPRMSTNGEEMGPDADNIVLIWKTKVCW
ncbi:hypothetical protein BP6252_12627 [Coleophoma cylindrospora]|uniref:Uncharacterized protein n=1 Tax=Coleophoma cylindrospora TaxID=1849047 RepID=A0A3D8QD11_9HELO|nr:hypothetical protein BP6252_12627 [Coleophoma cylindrospora]